MRNSAFYSRFLSFPFSFFLFLSFFFYIFISFVESEGRVKGEDGWESWSEVYSEQEISRAHGSRLIAPDLLPRLPHNKNLF